MKKIAKTPPEEVKFYGIDSWSRPIFRSIKHPRNFFGSVTKLCSNEKEAKKITEFDLCFFGNSFDCEPMGTLASNIKIIKEE